MRALLLILALACPIAARGAAPLEVAIGSSRTSVDADTIGGDFPITCPACPGWYAWQPTVIGGEWFSRVGFAADTINLGIGGATSVPAFLPNAVTQAAWAKQLGATRVWVFGFVVNDCRLGAAPATIVARHLALRTQLAPAPVVFIGEAPVSADPSCAALDAVAVNACIAAVNAQLATHPPYVALALTGAPVEFEHDVCAVLPAACRGETSYCDGLHHGEVGHEAIAAAVRAWLP